AFELIRPGTDSPRETWLRLLLIRAGLPEPRVNARISADGEIPERFGDLVYRRERVVVEYEGAHHSESRTSYLSDIRRFEQLADWRFVRVTQEDAADPDGIIRRVRAALSRAA